MEYRLVARRVIVVQYAGDYRAADRLARESGAETYYGHRHVLDTLAAIAGRGDDVAILCCKAPEAHDEYLPSGVRVIGMADPVRWNGPEPMAVIEDFAPTHMIVLGPMPAYIRLAIRRRARLLCIFADSFELGWLRRFVRYGRLASLLRRRQVEWIANHGINACVSLARLGVPAARIVPWDWPQVRAPEDLPARPCAPDDPVIFFAGQISERKGVRDLVTAIAILKRRGVSMRAEIAGAGDIATFAALAESLGVADRVSFPGLVTNAQVVAGMRGASMVAVTSQHAYPEGLPLTIYEALCARTPIVASDHPMFLRRLEHERTALIYRSGDAEALADAAQRLVADDALFARLSEASAAAWHALHLPVKGGTLLSRWLNDTDEDRAWIAAHRLDSGRYEAQIDGGPGS